MSQMGMQMPGRARSAKPKLNAYTGLMLAAVAALAFATVFAFFAASTIGPGGGFMGAFKVHEQPRQPGGIRFAD
ncbi:MAG: hypothetical protein ACTS3F_07710 [Phycisphaerales bacterium]